VTALEAIAPFRHEAVLYAGEDAFVDRVASFVAGGITAGEPTLVMTNARKIDALQRRLGDDTSGLVEYQDMEIVGANPARIIPAWDDFATRQTAAGMTRLRGVGEPIWAGRSPVELTECHWHEALINRAFADASGFWLICPYDVSSLDSGVVQEAHGTHPVISGHQGPGSAGGSSSADSGAAPRGPMATELEQPSATLHEMDFDAGRLSDLRRLVATASARAGVSPRRIDDLVVAVNEVATNSVTHGGGHGTAKLWRDDDAFVCEIRDAGVITDPLADRTRPGANPIDARGLWIANRLCDLVQLRSSEHGSVVRLRMRTAGATR
jgi:anti-sigma regulatory factor (Ser/Thr protein kinase)